MAEIRKHNPDEGDAIARLVREALGETIRPTTPGQARTEQPVSGKEAEETITVTALPGVGPIGPMISF